jgi:hypothetical protein
MIWSGVSIGVAIQADWERDLLNGTEHGPSEIDQSMRKTDAGSP